MTELADFLGTHAVAMFGCLLLALLAVMLAGWSGGTPSAPRWWYRGKRRARCARLRRGGAGVSGVLAAVTLFIAIAANVGAGGAVADFDLVFSASLQPQVSAATRAVFAVATRLGDTSVLTMLGMVVAWALLMARRWIPALAWSLAMSGHGLINTSLKSVFQRARPLHDQAFSPAGDFSFPSGHASGAMVAYGMLTWLILPLLPPRWRPPAVLFAAAIIATVGFSRLVLQRHFPSDVVAGFLSGGAWLATCIMAARAAMAGRPPAMSRKRPPRVDSDDQKSSPG